MTPERFRALSEGEKLALLSRAEKHIRDLATKLGAEPDQIDEATAYLHPECVVRRHG